MRNQENQVVRVSVLFDESQHEGALARRGVERYKQKMHTARERRAQLVRWLDSNHIDYRHLSEAGAFDTLFLDVAASAIPKLTSFPGVLDVSIDTEFRVDLLERKDK